MFGRKLFPALFSGRRHLLVNGVGIFSFPRGDVFYRIHARCTPTNMAYRVIVFFFIFPPDDPFPSSNNVAKKCRDKSNNKNYGKIIISFKPG